MRNILRWINTFQKSYFSLLELKSFKMIKTTFYFTLKDIFVIFRYLNFCPDFYDHVGKKSDKKTKVNFKIYSIKNWETNIYNIFYPIY